MAWRIHRFMTHGLFNTVAPSTACLLPGSSKSLERREALEQRDARTRPFNAMHLT